MSDEALSGMTVGMVYDLMTEQVNDSEKYDIKGTQDDIRRIFG